LICVKQGDIDGADNDYCRVKPVKSISKVMFEAISEQLGYQFEAEKAEEGEIKLFQDFL
jgi:hypothetical protein